MLEQRPYQRIFEEEMVDQICTVPFSSLSLDDKLIWKANEDDKFTVRSAYYLEGIRNKREIA